MSIDVDLTLPNGVTTAPVLEVPRENLPEKRRFAGAVAFGYPRNFLGNRFTYLTISPRARGLSIGMNLNPDRKCNFDCIYCEVDRSGPVVDEVIDCEIAGRELEALLTLVHGGGLQGTPPYSTLPPELVRLRHLALSGDGEPTLSPRFLEAVETAVHIRALGRYPFFKIVLITNASHLELPGVQAGPSLLTPKDEVWAKLDAGTQEYFEFINRSTVPLDKIVENILLTARKRPVIIQSLFSEVGGAKPAAKEIDAYAGRLLALKEGGADIRMVQIYSATRPAGSASFAHLPLRTMSEIASRVRQVAGLPAEVF